MAKDSDGPKIAGQWAKYLDQQNEEQRYPDDDEWMSVFELADAQGVPVSTASSQLQNLRAQGRLIKQRFKRRPGTGRPQVIWHYKIINGTKQKD
jgi:predicted ArsR family transcriptional regulator